MLILEEVKKDAVITGIEPGQVVRVVTTEPVGGSCTYILRIIGLDLPGAARIV